jgi:hypothetical protein
MKNNLFKFLAISTLAIVVFFNISLNGKFNTGDINLIQEAKACWWVGETTGGSQCWCNCSYDERCQLEAGGGVIYWDDAPARFECA